MRIFEQFGLIIVYQDEFDETIMGLHYVSQGFQNCQFVHWFACNLGLGLIYRTAKTTDHLGYNLAPNSSTS